MSKTQAMIRRASAAVAVALTMLAITGTGAQAFGVTYNGGADAQALRIVLQIPSSHQLKTTLAAVGLPTDALPIDDAFKAQTLEIDVSSNHGVVTSKGANGS